MFFVNIPFGIASAVIIGIALKEPERHGKRSIDYAGAILLTTSVTMLLLALVEGGESLERLVSAGNLALFILAVTLLAAFIAVERRAAEPIVPLSLFENRVVTLA
ncbi:MAG: MFS transporter, partial [Thermoanaerobaculia bacterium]